MPRSYLILSGMPGVVHSFPTRRSSDLPPLTRSFTSAALVVLSASEGFCAQAWLSPDRKSTRLNSSHLGTSYAVFCLKKKTVVYSRQPDLFGKQPHPKPTVQFPIARAYI